MKKLALFICIVMIAGICGQAEYGHWLEEGGSFYAERGDESILFGRLWVFSNKEEDEDGYHRIDIQDGNGKSTFFTTNILRVNQIKCLEAFDTSLDVYNELDSYLVYGDKELYECSLALAEVKSLADLLLEKINNSSNSSAEQDREFVEQTVADCEKKYTEAQSTLMMLEEQRENALTALELIVEALQEVFDIDADFAWITEDNLSYYKAYIEAYPEYVNDAKMEVLSEFATVLTDEEIIAVGSEIAEMVETDLCKEFAKLDENEFENIYQMQNYISTVRKQRVEGKLEEYKQASAQAMTKAATALRNSKDAEKNGNASKSFDKVTKRRQAIESAYESMLEIASKYDVTPSPVNIESYKGAESKSIERELYIDDILASKIAIAINTPTLMETPCTVKLKKGTLTIICANGITYSGTFEVPLTVEIDKEESTSKSIFD